MDTVSEGNIDLNEMGLLYIYNQESEPVLWRTKCEIISRTVLHCTNRCQITALLEIGGRVNKFDQRIQRNRVRIRQARQALVMFCKSFKIVER